MYDVIIVGSGGAGLSAALWAKKSTNNIVLVSKTYPTHSQTCQAQGGINAVLESTKNDSVEEFIENTYNASKKLSSLALIKTLCEDSKETIKWLDEIGVPFSRDEKNNISQRKFGGTKAKRTCYSSDYTGLKILHTLYDQCIKEGIKFLNEHQLLSINTNENKTTGINLLNIQSGEIKTLNAKTVVLASGGYAGIFENNTTNSVASTGDGIYCAFKAGAKLSNMEFIQFHPTTLESSKTLISESARAEGGYLVDSKGKRFIDELKPRDEVSRAIYKKLLNNEKVYLDTRHIKEEELKSLMPQELRLIKEFTGLNMAKDLIAISPAAHYSMGGILVDKNLETTIKNLYACGECSQSQIHGANRLGGNSLLEIISFGKKAGIKASKEASAIKTSSYNCEKEKDEKRIKKLLKNKEVNFYKKKEYLGELLFENVGVFREESKLLLAKNEVMKLKEELDSIGTFDKNRTYNKNLCELLEYESIINLSYLIIISALNRKESRGAHFREDYMQEHSSYNKNSNIELVDGQIRLNLEEVQ